jgi:DeoR/GlpR family transcriptional regulator of sugar metabolism
MISGENRELAAQRLEKLRGLLRERRIMRVDEIARALRVSGATARRDLGQLERQGDLRRVHGGAVGVERRLDEPLFDDKASLAAREKQRIAEAALRLIKPRDSLFLDGGSTVLALAKLLAARADLTVVTNSLRVAAELAGAGPRLIVVGGELRRLSQTFVGSMTRFTLDQIHVDRAFIGTIGITPEEGLTTTDPREAYTKTLIMEHARQVILLADRSKFGKLSFARFGELAKLHTIVTDSGADRLAVRALKKRNIHVICA